MSLLNVRLDADDQAKVRTLRAQGIRISDLVRSAIRNEFNKLRRPRTARDLVAVIRELDAKYPVRDDEEPSINPRNRAEFQQAAAEHFGRLNRKRG